MRRKPFLLLVVGYCLASLVVGLAGSVTSPSVALADGNPPDPPYPIDSIEGGGAWPDTTDELEQSACMAQAETSMWDLLLLISLTL